MIKIDELREFRPTYKYDNGSGITLDAVKRHCPQKLRKTEFPWHFMPIKSSPAACSTRRLRIALLCTIPSTGTTTSCFALESSKRAILPL